MNCAPENELRTILKITGGILDITGGVLEIIGGL